MKIRHIPLHPDEFLAAISGEMSPAELGVYWMVCLLQYSRGSTIKPDLNWLRAKFRPSKANRVVGDILEALIASGRVYRDGDEIGVRRCREELERATRAVLEASESGARGGRPNRKNNKIGKGTPFSAEKLTNNQEPVEGSTEPNGSSEPENKRVLTRDELFETWWKVYPHRVGKAAARAKFAIAIRAGTSLDMLVAGVDRYVRTKPPDRPWANPATWLYQQRWLDEPAHGLTVIDGGGEGVSEELPEDVKWRARLAWSQKHGRWLPTEWGPPPTDGGCAAPHAVLVEFGFRDKEGVG